MGPHEGQRVETAGRPLGKASAAMILVHGRGAGPANILELAGLLPHPEFAYLAPAASGGTWYPYSFMADVQKNEPGISSGLAVLKALVDRALEEGIAREKIVLGGFSQGACLMSEFAVRNAARYGGALAFSGGVIGPPGTSWDYEGNFAGMPFFLGCSDIDPHIPMTRIEETSAVLTRMGAAVEKRIYPGMGHLINEDEIAYARALVASIGG